MKKSTGWNSNRDFKHVSVTINITDWSITSLKASNHDARMDRGVETRRNVLAVGSVLSIWFPNETKENVLSTAYMNLSVIDLYE